MNHSFDSQDSKRTDYTRILSAHSTLASGPRIGDHLKDTHGSRNKLVKCFSGA